MIQIEIYTYALLSYTHFFANIKISDFSPILKVIHYMEAIMNYKNIFLSIFSILLLGCVQLTSAMKITNKQAIDTANILFQACEKGNFGLVKHLIENGANGVNVHSKDRIGGSLLHYACKNGHNNIVNYLLKNGANPSAEGYCKWTPLHVACEMGFYETAKDLIANGADIYAQDTDGITPLIATCVGIAPNLSIIKLLLKDIHVNDTQCGYNNTILHTASQNGHYEIVSYLIQQQDIDINAKNIYGSTPLIFAASKGHLDIVKLLLKNGADIGIKTYYLASILHAAVYHNQSIVVEYLLNHAPELIEVQTIDGVTALDVAYDQKNETIINMFKQHGVQTVSEKQAEANMRAFFAELDQEAQQKQMARAKKKQRNVPKQQQNQNTIPTNKQKNNKTQQKPKSEPSPMAMASKLITNNTVQPMIELSTGAITTIPTSPTEIVTANVNNNTNESTTTASSTTCITNDSSSKAPITMTIKQPSTLQNVSSNKSQPTQTNNEYQIGYDKKLKWPRSLKGEPYNSMREHLRKLKRWPKTTGLDIKLLKKDQSGMYRLRVGVYRVVFMIDTALHRIIINKIGFRKKVYRNL